MLLWFTVLLLCQLAGEATTIFLNLPVPGPVCGMAYLFCGLLWHGRVPEQLGHAAGTLLSNLSLLFVPAGVGIMLHLDLLKDEWLPLSVSLIVSTLLAIAVTGALMSFFIGSSSGGAGAARNE